MIVRKCIEEEKVQVEVGRTVRSSKIEPQEFGSGLKAT